MAEQWVSAARALEIGRDPVTICTRANARLIATKAQAFHVDGKAKDADLVPPEFWWAKGFDALKQDWASGDFSTWIDQRHHLQAFGVSFSLSGLLNLVQFEERALLAQSLSVVSNKDWVSASEVSQLSIEGAGHAGISRELIIEQARLGFVSARAVEARGTTTGRDKGITIFDEREWDVPVWFWEEFTGQDKSNQNWEIGKFSGRGRSPRGRAAIELSGVHFLRASIEARFGAPDSEGEKDAAVRSTRGRKAKYDWASATAAVWGQLFRSELQPQVQADIERALIMQLSSAKSEPSESTVRPYAKPIWEEYQKP